MSILKTVKDVHLFMMLVGELMRELMHNFVLVKHLSSRKVVTRSISELVYVLILYGLSGAEVPSLLLLNIQTCTCLAHSHLLNVQLCS